MPLSSVKSRSPLRRAARIAAVVAWCGLIFAASSRPDLRVSDDHLLDFVLRKAAHMAVFGVLALLVLHALDSIWTRRRSMYVAAWLLTLVYAISDEWHQTFVEGRVGHASDVLIDMVGATIALAALARQSERPTS